MKPIWTLVAMAVASLAGTHALAQSDKPGEDRAATVAPATPAEKAQARQARKAQSRALARSDRNDADTYQDPPRPRSKLTKAERKAAAAKRKAEGADAARQAKDSAGLN
jgi:hypothetical protein